MAVKAKHVALEKGLNKRPIVVYEGQMLLSLFLFFSSFSFSSSSFFSLSDLTRPLCLSCLNFG